MKKDKEIIETIIADGLIGKSLSALITKKRKGIASIGSIAGAALIATFNANENAIRTNIPFLIEESGNIFEIQGKNLRKLVRKIDKPLILLPKNFKLK